MYHSSLRRGIRATALAFLVLATLVGAGCGKDGGSSLTDPPSDPGPTDPGPSDPEPASWPGPAPVGHVMYAVDLSNNFLVFGSESMNVLTAKMRISGLPILKRIIGIAMRPSNGKLYGVGNDSRVYIIDPLTAEATPVSSGQFSPKIIDMFDIHFAMDLEPKAERVRLIAAESGANWSISLDDGTATTGETARYATGTPLEGQTPRLLGMYFAPPPEGSVGMCDNLAYAIDADEAIMIAACDPATGEWWPTGSPPQASLTGPAAGKLAKASLGGSTVPLEDLKDQLARCGEVMPSPGDPDNPGEPPPPEGGPWYPRSPDTPTYVFLVELGHASNRVGVVKPFDTDPFMLGVTDHWEVPSEEPIQTVEWAGHGISHPNLRQELRHEARPAVQRSVAGSPEPESSTPPAPPSDPRAQCGS
jgi:hypothetical protein